MPFREWQDDLFPAQDVSPTAERVPSWGDTIDAAFGLENDVIAGYNLMNRPVFKAQPNYPLVDRLKAAGIPEWEWEDYVGVQSDDELIFAQQQIIGERKRRDVLARSGGAGIAAGVAAGILSPTIFIPILGTGSRAARIAKAFGYSAAAATAQEAALLQDQRTRTDAEALFSIGASTVLGGILGTAASLLSKVEFDRMASDMVNPNLGTTIPKVSSVGAEAVAPEIAGKFKYGPGIDTLSRIGPVTRVIQQPHAPKIEGVKLESAQARWIGSQFGDAGLGFERNIEGIAAAPGGNIEHMATTYMRNLFEGLTASDRAYKEYFFAGNPPRVLANTIATASSLLGSTRMNREQFNQAITEHIWTGIESPIPQVNQAAAAIEKKLFRPLFDEAVEVGIYDIREDVEGAIQKLLKADKSYATRMFLAPAVQRNLTKFIKIIADRYENKLNEAFLKEFERFVKRKQKITTRIEDLERPAKEVQELRNQLLEDLKKLESDRSPETVKFATDLKALRSALRNEKDPTKKKSLKEALRKFKEKTPLEYSKLNEKRGVIRARLRNLLHSRAMAEERQLIKLDKIEKLEELSLAAMSKAATVAYELITFLRKGRDTDFNKKIKSLQKEFADALAVASRQLDKYDEQVTKLVSTSPEDTNKLLAIEQRTENITARLNARVAELEKLETFDRAAWRVEVQQAIDDIMQPTLEINNRRALRMQRLMEQADRLDPALIPGKVEKLKKKLIDAATQLRDRLRERGGLDIDLDSGKASFREFAEDIARDAARKILGVNGRIQFNDLIREKRGPEIARALDVPSIELKDFLDHDIDRIMRVYARTMAADISIARRLGTPNGQLVFENLARERFEKTEAVAKLKDKKGNPLSQEKQEKYREAIGDFYDSLEIDLQTLLQRVRHERGVPQDPESWAARGASLALMANTMRYMGGVTISSLADPGRVIQRFGLTRTFRDAFLPFITALKELRMSQREGKLAGTALDPVLHARAQSVFDLMDDVRPRTKIERVAQWGTSKIGLIALFDYWTSAWKQVAAGLANAKLLDAIETVMTNRGGEKALKRATEYLAKKNLVGDDVPIIWQQVTGGPGGGKVKGVWLPNTDKWNISDPNIARALRSYRSALVSEVDDTIITPGLERPSWVDRNLPGKLIAQFKSFGFSSTTKTLMAGLQERDAAHLNGMLISLALGALSYYTWAVSVGGAAYTEMKNASYEKWIDEAISRSGMLSAFDFVQQVGQSIPLTRPYMSLSGGISSRREGGDLVDALSGPSMDALDSVARILIGIDSPTRTTLHAARKLLPYQNLIGWRRALDAIESSVADTFGLPEWRK
jgi:hypothetical protein